MAREQRSLERKRINRAIMITKTISIRGWGRKRKRARSNSIASRFSRRPI